MLHAKNRVFASVSIELANLFSVLYYHYSRPGRTADLADLARLEAYLEARLVEYDPESAHELSEDLFLNSD